jgi:type VI protein secretion system component VasF
VDEIASALIFFLDYAFADPSSPAAFREEWNRSRMAADPSIINERHHRMLKEENLSGDDAFFDLVEQELEERPDDRAANERLVLYYIAIGLGFMGFFRKGTEKHKDELRGYMNRIYPRIKDWVDSRPDDRLTPGAYDALNDKDYVTPARELPLILVAGFILLAMTLLVGYAVLFEIQADPLVRLLENVGGFATDATQDGTGLDEG